jgi:hypothetical protein
MAALPEDNLVHLSDWAIDDLTVWKVNKKGFPKAVVFSVNLSVKPTYPIGLNAVWMAGSVSPSPGRDDSWGQKRYEFELQKNGDGLFYEIRSGTGGVLSNSGEEAYDWIKSPGEE